MNCTIHIDERCVIPRWKSLHASLIQNELSGVQKSFIPISGFGINEYEQSKIEWQIDRNLPNAIEYIYCARAASVEVDNEALKFVRRLISRNEDVPVLVKDFISEKKLFDDITPTNGHAYWHHIAFFRSRTILDPNNALYWAELARCYLIVGEIRKSERALRIANQLSPNNRYLIRATARYFHHNKDIDQALYTLRRSELINNDPWLLASEVAISRSAKRPSQKLKMAKIVLNSNDFLPASISELSSEFATLEAFSGDNKESKKLFRKALICPNENSFAQVVWANERLLDLQYDQQLINEIVDCFESKVWVELFGSKDWRKISEYLNQWCLFQPFSSVPLIMRTMVLLDFLDDYSSAIELCETGLDTHKGNFSLSNNLAYALLLSGDQVKAKMIIDECLSHHTDAQEEILFLAASGMYEMRYGDADSGKAKYEAAIEIANRMINPENCSVIIYFAREKKRLGEDIRELAQNIMKILSSTKNPFIPELVKKFELL